MLMSYNSDVRVSITSLEHSKFVEISNDARLPATSAIRIQYTESTELPPITSVDVYPKHAVVTYIANVDEISTGIGSAVSSPVVQNWGVVKAEFGSSYVAFPSVLASTVNVLNNTGTTITLKKTSGTTGIPLPDKSSVDINVVANANEISLIRTDGSSSTVSAYGIITQY